MINVQHWLMHHPYYDSECELGVMIRNAQREAIEREGKGVPVDTEIMQAAGVACGKETTSFPVFFSNTTDVDFREAMFVMGNRAVLYSDLKRFWSLLGDSGEDNVLDTCAEFSCEYADEECNIDNGEEYQVAGNSALLKQGTSVELTPGAKSLHRSIESAGTDRSGPPSDELKAEAFKTMKDTFDLISNDKFCTQKDLLDYMSNTIEQRNKFLERKSAQVGLQRNGGIYVMLKRSPVKTTTKREKRLKGLAG